MPAAEAAVTAPAAGERAFLPLSWALAAFALALPVSIAGLNAGAAAVTLALLWCGIHGEDVPWKSALTPFTLAVAAYCAAAVLVSALGVAPSVSFGQVNKDFHKLWLLGLLLVALRLGGTRSLSRALGWSCAAVSVYGVGQALILRSAGTMVRAHAFVHPVVFGELVGLCWLGALALWLSPARDSPSRRSLLVFLGLAGAALLLSQDRGAVLGTAVGAAVLGLADRRYRRISMLSMVCLPAVVLFWELLPSNHNIAATLARLREPGPHGDLARLTFWRVGLEMFRDHPWHGVGIGNYRTLFDRYFQGIFEGERVWGSAHNLFIQQAAERGLIGLAALGAVLWTMTASCWRRARAGGSAADLWALSACAAFVVMNLTEVAFQTEQVASLMIFIWAYAETRHGADAAT